MRPAELDHTRRAKHFFDTANGEVLVGVKERQEYLASGVGNATVVELGPLLRVPGEVSAEWHYQRLRTGEWNRQQYIEYGKWLKYVVAPPQENEQRITKDIITNAGRLGLGPGMGAIRTEFGNTSQFYVAIRAADTHRESLFDEWTMQDFADHVRRIGGDRKPKRADIDKIAAANPNMPSARIIEARFKESGCFEGALMLAGYQVTRRWTKDDYIAWGLKFMEANDGILPVQTSINYLSLQSKGPGAKTVHSKFDNLTNYQIELRQAYGKYMAEKMQSKREKVTQIVTDWENGLLPQGLFASSAEESLPPLDAIRESLGDSELIVRYAKYRVLEQVAPGMSIERRVDIAKGDTGDRDFIPAIRKSQDVRAGDIEYAALTLGFFDDIWPMNAHLESLRLDEGYSDFVKHIRSKKKVSV